jgi:hypothetical protein
VLNCSLNLTPSANQTLSLVICGLVTLASGIANGAESCDQEITGEVINGYYDLLIFAEATCNNALSILLGYFLLLKKSELNPTCIYIYM